MVPEKGMDTYKATNTLNGKFYIGSAINFEKRKKEHLSSTLNYPFQNALRANPEAFEWEVWSDESENRELEQALLDMWYGKEQCYNLNPTASAPPVLKGELNPRFGLAPEENPLFGKKWWVSSDGSDERFLFNSPGGGWQPGRKEVTEISRQKQSESIKGLRWWVDPSGEMLRQRNCPGPEWTMGMSDDAKRSYSRANEGERNPAFGKKWWVNPNGETLFDHTQPGPEWQNGRVYRLDLGV